MLHQIVVSYKPVGDGAAISINDDAGVDKITPVTDGVDDKEGKRRDKSLGIGSATEEKRDVGSFISY